MDYIANVENSEIDVSGIRTVLVQGDSSYPVIRFVLDPALTGLNWRVRGTYTATNIAVLSPEIAPTESATEITLDWSVGSDFTTYDGDMQLSLVGANDAGTTVVKALADITIQKDWSIGTMGSITLNLFEQLMAQVQAMRHNDFSGIQGGSLTERYHLTAAEHTIVGNTSGVNTGDQDVSGAISTHNADAGAHAGLFAAVMADIALRHALHYTFRWDKVNALGVRLNSLANIGTNIASYCHLGTLNTTLSNPFDSIYPWKDRNVCNISIDAYRALSSGASLQDCIISWLGDPDFDYAHVNGAWVCTPEFWYKVWDEGGYRYFDISPIAITGYIHAPETIEGRWHGGTYTLTIDGVSKSCLLPKPGMPGKNVTLSTLHTYAKNWGASVENIYGYSATDVLMIVEFATMNTQTAIGNGAIDLYRQSSDTIQAEATASATVKVLTAAAASCIAGSIFDIGTANGAANIGSFIIASTALDTDPTYTVVTLTTDGSTPASVTVTTDHFWSVHGLSNMVDASIGAASGYIGTNGKSHAYYRGQVAHANMWRYVLGAYRQTGTGKIWIANNPAEADAYDALNTTVHKDTGFALPQGAEGAATSGYISALRLCPDVPAAPFCETIGGSSANPVGDYCYVPALATADTILIAGGDADYGATCGRFYGNWGPSAAHSSWRYGAVPVLKSP